MKQTMKKESIKKAGNIELEKYEDGKYGIVDHISGEDSGPRYKSLEMAEKIFSRFVEEDN